MNAGRKRPSVKPAGGDRNEVSPGKIGPNDIDDAALFRSAIGPIRELPSTVAPPPKPKPRPLPRMGARDDALALDEFRRTLSADVLETGDALSFRRDHLPMRVFQRLRRGQYSAQDEVDLHHSDAVQAEAMLRHFLGQSRGAGLGCVRIVHGKGLHSDTGVPVLKNMVDRLLRQRTDVLAFHSAPSAQGGHGAVLVLLSQHR